MSPSLKMEVIEEADLSERHKAHEPQRPPPSYFKNHDEESAESLTPACAMKSMYVVMNPCFQRFTKVVMGSHVKIAEEIVWLTLLLNCTKVI